MKHIIQEFVMYAKEYAIEYKNTLLSGSISIFSVIISFVESLEVYIRLAGGIIGIAVGIFTLYRLYLDIQLKRKKLKEND